MEFNICLVERHKISSLNTEEETRENKVLEIMREKEYDSELDDATSVIFDICSIFEETRKIKFLVQGFGDDSWPVDCRYDLPNIIEDMHYFIKNKILSGNYNFQLRFDEQGIQRYIDVKDKGGELELICHSYTGWRPVPESVKINKNEFSKKMMKLYNDFIVYASELCPLLISQPMLSEWKIIEDRH